MGLDPLTRWRHRDVEARRDRTRCSVLLTLWDCAMNVRNYSVYSPPLSPPTECKPFNWLICKVVDHHQEWRGSEPRQKDWLSTDGLLSEGEWEQRKPHSATWKTALMSPSSRPMTKAAPSASTCGVSQPWTRENREIQQTQEGDSALIRLHVSDEGRENRANLFQILFV